jgi:hypothetical protein
VADGFFDSLEVQHQFSDLSGVANARRVIAILRGARSVDSADHTPLKSPALQPSPKAGDLATLSMTPGTA